jgi:AraC family transcriptional regulator
MTSRIMMTARGKTLPLTLSAGERPEPLLNSAGTSWAGLQMESHVLRPVSLNVTTGPVKDEYGMLVIMNGRAEIVLNEGKRHMNVACAPGTALLLAGHSPFNLVRVEGSAEAVALCIPGEWFRRVLLDRAPRAFGTTQPIYQDQTVLLLIRAMCQEVANDCITGRIYAESLTTALLSYVVERTPFSTFRPRRRLSESQRRRLQSYILDSLHKDLSLIDLASVVELSPRHFSGLFHQAFGMAPHQYVVHSRLEEAARMLESQDPDIAEIALRVGFSSQSHFTAAFRRAFGITPSRYSLQKRKSFLVDRSRENLSCDEPRDSSKDE